MKAVAKALYSEPVVFLATVQGAATALATAAIIPTWVPLVTLAIITPAQRFYVRPRKRRR
jgi:hypothetical protein